MESLVTASKTAMGRLHDAGKSGWFLFLCLIPFVGGVITLFLLVQPSDGPNEYGAASQD
jgi:uncharacterized membrane protein YhaH (DUF805 family)